MRLFRLMRASLSMTCMAAAALSFAAGAPQTTPIPDSAYTNPTALAQPVIVPPEPVLNAKGYVLMDAQSGNIIAQKNMNQRMQPASLTKMMTLYIISENLAAGRIHLNDLVPVSKAANAIGGSRMFIKAGTKVPVQDLMRGIIVDSGNDACTAMAEYIGGNEATFAQIMNTTAQQLGMHNTHFVDSTGLPRAAHYSTPHDIALLARALVMNFPQYYPMYKEKWFTYNGIRQPNRNRLLWRSKNFDGVKTGHTAEAGYCLVASGDENGNRLISVVMGTPTDMARANDSQALLNYGFRFFRTYPLYHAMKPITQARVWFGVSKFVPVGIARTLYVTVPTGSYKQMKAAMTLQPNIQAPIAKGQSLGQVQVKLNNKIVAQVPLIALSGSSKGGIWVTTRDHVSKMFSH